MINKLFVSLKLRLALLLLFPVFFGNLQAAAPSSVAGWTFFVRISEGGFGMGESGSFLLCFTQGEARIVSLSNIADNVGTYTYSASGAEGKVTLGNIVMTFVFTDDRRGNYGLIRGGTVGGGYQMGKFSAAGGTAPDVATSIIDFNGKRADMPALRVNYRLVTSAGNTYYRLENGLPTTSYGFSVQKLNASTTRLFFSDATMGTGHTHLMFITPTTGLYAYKIGSGKAYEEGTFSLQVAAEPEITTQPKDQKILHGGTATFSVSATGSQPVTIQWYKDEVPIPGATQTNLVISPVTANDEGLYRAVASNFLGVGISNNARLTPICPTTIGKDYAWFEFTGGTGSLEVASDCVWGVSNTNSWIEVLPQSDESGVGTLYFSASRNSSAAARTGYITIGNQIFRVAQKGTWTPSTLAGKTLRLDMNIGTEESPTNATEFYATFTGRTNNFYYSTIEGALPTDYPYTYVRSNAIIAKVTLLPEETIVLTFSNYTSGRFVLTNANPTNFASYSGRFTLSQRRGDLTTDGFPDLRFQNSAGHVQTLFTDGDSVAITIDTNPVRKIIGSADFTRDGRLDRVYLSPERTIVVSPGTNLLVLRGGARLAPTWRPITAEDLSGDDYPDVLFQNDDGRLAYWEIGGATNYFKRSFSVRDGKPTPTNWLAVSAVDINGDRQQDVVLWNQATRKAAVWFFHQGDFIESATLGSNNTNVLGSNWRIRGSADMNSDGQNDLLWQNRHSGKVTIWLMNGTNYLDGYDLDIPADPSWILIGPR